MCVDSGEAVQCYHCNRGWVARLENPINEKCVMGQDIYKTIPHFRCEYGCLLTRLNALTSTQGKTNTFSLDMLKIERDIKQQYLKIVNLRFVKSE